MTDLHPEHLLGNYGRDPHRRPAPALVAHVSQCDICAVEVAARRAAADDLSGRAPIDLDACVGRALDQLQVQAVDDDAPPRGAVQRRMTIAVALAAAASLAAVVLAATFSGEGLDTDPTAERSQAVRLGAPVPTRDRAEPAAVTVESTDLTSVPRPTPPAIAAPDPAPTVQPSARPQPRPRSTEAQPNARSAAELFDEATALVRRGRSADALEVFAVLQHEHPHSREADTSLAIAGRVWLDDERKPAKALVAFDAYLRGGSTTLRPEVLAAKAAALEALGRQPEANEVYRVLASKHPDTAPGRDAAIRIGDSP